MWSASQKYGSFQSSALTAASAAWRCEEGLGADDRVFAVRLVPDGNDLDAALQSLDAGLQLCFGLVSEPVAGSYGILVEHSMLCLAITFLS